MTNASFDRLLNASRLAMPAIGGDDFRADRSIRLTRPDRERLEGKVKSGRARAGGGGLAKSAGLSRLMDKRTPIRRFGLGADAGASDAHMAFDRRQRAITKVHYFNHSGGGGGALKAHAAYVARDAATRDDPSDQTRSEERGEARDAEGQARAHAAYLSRDGQAAR